MLTKHLRIHLEELLRQKILDPFGMELLVILLSTNMHLPFIHVTTGRDVGREREERTRQRHPRHQWTVDVGGARAQ